jgi:hypothetical protein
MPQLQDIQIGNALNDALQYISQGRFTSSVLNAAPVPLSVDLVRRVPFRLGEKGEVISIRRMTHRGDSWPTAFQDKSFAKAKLKYDRVLNRALDESLQAKIQASTIAELKVAVEELYTLLKAKADVVGEKSLQEGIIHIMELRKFAAQLEIKKVQEVLIFLDGYSGKTVEDLRKFMNDHSLGFGPAEHPDEKAAYRDIYIALKTQGEALGMYQQELGDNK